MTGASVRFSVLYAAVYVNPGVFTPFFPLFLTHQGFDPAAIGLMLALTGPARVIGNPLMLWMLDLGAPARLLLIGANIIGALLTMATIYFVSFWPMTLLLVLISLVHAPTIAVLDATATRASRNDPTLRYGMMRLWGSISFIVATLVAGVVLQRTSPLSAVWLLAGAMAMAALCAVLTPREQTAGAAQTAQPKGGRQSASLALAAAIAASALIQSSHAALYGFSSIHWRAQGYSGELIGMMWVIGAVAEILLFVRYAALAPTPRKALSRLMLIAGVAIIRWIGMSLDPSLAATMALQILHAVTFAATHLAAMSAISLLAPPAWRGRAQGVHAAAIALLMSSATYASGLLYESYGVAAYAFMAGLAACGGLCAAVAWRLADKH